MIVLMPCASWKEVAAEKHKILLASKARSKDKRDGEDRILLVKRAIQDRHLRKKDRGVNPPEAINHDVPRRVRE